MKAVTLFEAWKLWLSGSLDQGTALWGLNILWWGRIGKLAQFAAALTIVADIVGPERLRRFGNSLHSAFTVGRAENLLVNSVEAAQALWGHWFAPCEKEAEAYKTALSFKANVVSMFICLGLTFICVYLPWAYLSWWQRAVVGVLSFYASYALSPVILTILLIILTLLGLSVDLLLVEPFAWLIERPQLDRWVKMTSAAMLVLGFHFDLLAS